jgi:transcriptional regulator with XRE-family HTH domain
MKALGERLKQARAEFGISQAALAAKAGVSTSAIGNLEAGIRNEPRELLAIAAALGVRAEWLKSGLLPRDAVAGDGPGPAVTLSAQDLQLLADLRELLPCEQQEVRESVRRRAEYARQVRAWKPSS